MKKEDIPEYWKKENISKFRLPAPQDQIRWVRITDAEGIPVYEGFARKNVPCGPGTAYYPDGTRYMEGVWGTKGLVSGREYYPNGQLRFEGAYQINSGYGPNFPVYGNFYDEEGNQLYEGAFKLKFGGVGWPFVIKPEEYGKVLQDNAPHVHERIRECLRDKDDED